MVFGMHSGWRMKLTVPVVMLALASAAFGAPDEATGLEWNVNSRYDVESVELTPDRAYKLSARLGSELQRMVGRRLDTEALSDLARRVRQELHARDVTFRVHRGKQPSHVRVTLAVENRESPFDVSLASLTYNSGQGFSGAGIARATFGDNVIAVTGVSNGDDLVQRYAGIRARYERAHFGSDRVRFGFEADVYGELLAPATLSSLSAGAYGSRTNFEPGATFLLSRPVSLTVGVSFENMRNDSKSNRNQAANALVGTLRYRRDWKGTNSQDLEASYRLRAATKALGSDYVYNRHTLSARYGVQRGRQSVEVAVTAGVIFGAAPLFERFVLGNNTTLRGWDKYDLDPLGGNRAVHASVTYGYQILRVFYDTGSVWDRGKPPQEKHSVGFGINTGTGRTVFGKNSILLALAFPIKQGRAEPVVLAGMNF